MSNLHKRPTRRKLAVGGAAAVASLAVMMAGGTAWADNGQDAAVQADGMAKAMADDFGITEDQAEQRLAADASASKMANSLKGELAATQTGGSYVKDGELVVTVTDDAAAAKAEAAGATTEQVSYSTAQLDRAKQGLDSYAADAGAGAVQSWYVDVTENTVVVNVAEGAGDAETAAFLSEAKDLGKKVDIQQTAAEAMPTADLLGGQEVQMSNGYVCSSGFNATTSGGDALMITAGHCADGSPSFSRDGVEIGETVDASFPGDDFASVSVSDAWTQVGGVDMYDGTEQAVAGSEEAAVGAAVCKSGRTTDWTCGEIVAEDQSVNYGNGDIVEGLVQHNACVEQGDSGGSNIAGDQAQGMSSGGQLFTDESGELVCGERVGEENVSFYQPINEALEANDAELVTADSAGGGDDGDDDWGW
ncbi:MAG: S1 family peptidase [Propionibacteriaceae bacterium]